MCLAQGPQRSDASEAQTSGTSVSSEALYHWVTALPSDEIWPKLKLIHTLMYVLATYKNEEDLMKTECARTVKTLKSYILDTQVGGQVWPKIKLIKALIVVLDTCKNDEDPSQKRKCLVTD